MVMLDFAYCLGLSEDDMSHYLENSVKAYLLREASACSNLEDQKKILAYSHCVKFACIFDPMSVKFEGGIDRSVFTKEKIEADSALLDRLDINIEKIANFTVEDNVYARMDMAETQQRIAEQAAPYIQEMIMSGLGGVE